MDVAALAIAILALGVSVVSLGYSRKQAQAAATSTDIESDRRKDEIAAKAALDEQSKIADLRITLAPSERNTGGRLIVSNRGPHVADAISVTFDAADDGDPAPITQRWRDLVGTLNPGDSLSAPAGLSPQTTRKFRVFLEWTDGRGPQRKSVPLREQ